MSRRRLKAKFRFQVFRCPACGHEERRFVDVLSEGWRYGQWCENEAPDFHPPPCSMTAVLHPRKGRAPAVHVFQPIENPEAFDVPEITSRRQLRDLQKQHGIQEATEEITPERKAPDYDQDFDQTIEDMHQHGELTPHLYSGELTDDEDVPHISDAEVDAMIQGDPDFQRGPTPDLSGLPRPDEGDPEPIEVE